MGEHVLVTGGAGFVGSHLVDALVAQILAASTFPDQVAIANYWMQQNKSLTGSALMEAVNKETWDPSVKALTQFGEAGLYLC